ncbi:MAG: gluconeogenesis factor YvcK family protein [Patescibacteria group bacterium]|jgi:uncharacterized cofD-like protein
MQKVKKIIYIGGGTGASVVLGGLKVHKNVQLTSVYPVTDSGGSTGRLLKENKDLLPMGDLRKMLLALMPENKTWKDILDFRFEKGEFEGHNLGNIIIANLQEKSGDIEKAIEELCKELKIKDKIMPVALKRADLCVELENGQVIKSETNIDEVIGFDGNLKIKKAWIEPKIKANPSVLKAIKEANLIVIGPGDLYTSVVACLCVSGIANALKASRAKIVYVSNIMTKFGQTNNFSVQDHVDVLEQYLGLGILDYVIYNKTKPSLEILKQHTEIKGNFVEFLNQKNTQKINYIGADLLGKAYKKKKSDVLIRSLIHHDSKKLAKILFELV